MVKFGYCGGYNFANVTCGKIKRSLNTSRSLRPFATKVGQWTRDVFCK